MNKQAIIFEVSDRSFEKHVIGNSTKAPFYCRIHQHLVRALLKSYGIVNQIEEMRIKARQHHMQDETPAHLTILRWHRNT